MFMITENTMITNPIKNLLKIYSNDLEIIEPNGELLLTPESTITESKNKIIISHDFNITKYAKGTIELN